MLRKQIPYGLCLPIFFLLSCTKDYFDASKIAGGKWNPEIAFPLVNSNLSIQDILTRADNTGYISVGSDKFCTLIYSGEVLSVKASEIIIIPNQTYNKDFQLDAAMAALLTSAGSVTVNTTQTVDFNPGSASIEVDSITFKACTLDVSINSSFKHNAQITITLPEAKKNGQVFTKTFNVNYTSVIPVTINAPCDLSGYTVDMTNGGASVNKLKINYTVKLTKTANPITGTEEISINQEMKNVEFGKIFGYIGQLYLSPDKDTVKIALFNSSLGTGIFSVTNPHATVTITNSWGMPISASMALLQGYTPGVGVYPITGSGIPNPLSIPSPDLSQVGQSLSDSFSLNKSNSNIASVINNQPKEVIYQINSLSNSAGNNSQNFVLDSSHFVVDLGINLPLYGKASAFTVQDTLAFSLEQIQDALEEIMLRMHITNGFPIDVGIQIYFTDSLYTKVDSLMTSKIIIPSATVDAVTGKVTTANEKTIDCYVDKARVQNKLSKATMLLINATISTFNNSSTDVKIYSDYNLGIEMGALTKLNVSY